MGRVIGWNIDRHTALVRKSRCARVKGLLDDAGLRAASGPDLGVRKGLDGLFEVGS